MKYFRASRILGLRITLVAAAMSLLVVIAPQARADVFTVGVGGSFASLDTALETAFATPGSHEVRVQKGTFRQDVDVTAETDSQVAVTGGWDVTFSMRDADPTATILDAEGDDLPFRLRLTGGVVSIDGLTITGGDNITAAGILLEIDGNGRATLQNNRILGNITSAGDFTVTGGVDVILGDGVVELIGNLISDNRAESTGNAILGAGLHIACSDSGLYTVRNNQIINNTSISDTLTSGGGVSISHLANCRGTVEDNLIAGNRVETGGEVRGAGLSVDMNAQNELPGLSLNIQRNRIWDNTSEGDPATSQVYLSAFEGDLRFADSIVADGDSGGIQIATFAGGMPPTLNLTNLTVTNHPGAGIRRFDPPGNVSVFNSIFFENGITAFGVETNDFGGADLGGNVIGIDPMFVNVAARDYHLRANSPAIDAGINTPPGGLSNFDLDGVGSPRLSGAAVDAGALEAGAGSPAFPDFNIDVTITNATGSFPATEEDICLPETNCYSGAVRSRSELFVRLIGPRPNGFFWVQIVRFTPSAIDVVIEQRSTGERRTYSLPALPPNDDTLAGLVDRTAFLPAGSESPQIDRGAPELMALSSLLLSAPRDLVVGSAFESLTDPAVTRSHLGGEFVTSPEFPDYRFRIEIVNSSGRLEATPESNCLPETVCFSGALAGRSELFIRLIGPRPNGFFWAQLVRFTPSEIEIEIEQISTGELQTYTLPVLSPQSDSIDGRVDRTAFLP